MRAMFHAMTSNALTGMARSDGRGGSASERSRRRRVPSRRVRERSR